MKKNTYKFSVDVVFAYNIFSTDTQKNLNFTVTTDICRDNFSDAVAAFKTYVRYITHDMIELSIPDLVEKRVEGILSISYECEQEGYFETDTNAVCVDSERIHYSRETHHDTIFESKRIATNIKWDTDGEEVDLPVSVISALALFMRQLSKSTAKIQRSSMICSPEKIWTGMQTKLIPSISGSVTAQM